MLLGILLLSLTIFSTNGLPFTDSAGNYHGTPQHAIPAQVGEEFREKDYYDKYYQSTLDGTAEAVTVCPERMACLDKAACPDGYLVTYDVLQNDISHNTHCNLFKQVCCKIIRELVNRPSHTVYNQTVENSFLPVIPSGGAVSIGESAPQYTDSQQIEDLSEKEYYDFNYDQSAFVQNHEDYTPICPADTYCVNSNLCINGYFSTFDGLSIPPHVPQRCDTLHAVCCKFAPKPDDQHFVRPNIPVTDLQTETEDAILEVPEPVPEYNQTAEEGILQFGSESATVDRTSAAEIAGQIPEAAGEESGGTPVEAEQAGKEFLAAIPVQTGCAAALLCVEEKFCSRDGTISTEPVVLTAKQLLRRVPLSNCKSPETGVIGKCCRDPNYVDPWPTGNLPPNYTGGFDEMGFPTFLNIAKVKAPSKPSQSTPKPAYQPVTSIPSVIRPESTPFIQSTVVPPVFPPNLSTSINELETNPIAVDTQENPSVEHFALQCGVKNKIPRRPEMEESETLFAEIPWQAMVLLTKSKKILCSGVLIDTENVLTAGNCIDGLDPSEVSIKLGEWKLGYELQYEEPLPFEIVNVSSIRMHPGYTLNVPTHDLAILHLERPAKLDYHVNPLCLPDTENVAEESRHCIATGWGKVILQSHYAGAIMHAVNMDILPPESCRDHLAGTEWTPEVTEGVICTKTEKEKNNVCEADVGGPLACENDRGFYELAGVYSQDTGCRSENQVAIFTPIDMAWLKEMLSVPQPNPSTETYRESNLSTDNYYLPPQ